MLVFTCDYSLFVYDDIKYESLGFVLISYDLKIHPALGHILKSYGREGILFIYIIGNRNASVYVACNAKVACSVVSDHKLEYLISVCVSVYTVFSLKNYLVCSVNRIYSEVEAIVTARCGCKVERLLGSVKEGRVTDLDSSALASLIKSYTLGNNAVIDTHRSR